jgi:aldehyde dehydrogenase (NAD+)
MIDRLAEIIRSTPWGDPRDPVNVVGPLIRAGQRERVAGIVDRARAAGARILAGGRRGDRDGRGFWYEPTLVDSVTEDSEIAQTEIFGPVLTVLRYAGGDDEAVRVANSTPYGLSAYVQSRDTDRARAIANRLRAGTVQVGASFATSPATPSGGYGISGIGRECGVDGLKECLQSKTVSMPG